MRNLSPFPCHLVMVHVLSRAEVEWIWNSRNHVAEFGVVGSGPSLIDPFLGWTTRFKTVGANSIEHSATVSYRHLDIDVKVPDFAAEGPSRGILPRTPAHM